MWDIGVRMVWTRLAPFATSQSGERDNNKIGHESWPPVKHVSTNFNSCHLRNFSKALRPSKSPNSHWFDFTFLDPILFRYQFSLSLSKGKQVKKWNQVFFLTFQSQVNKINTEVLTKILINWNRIQKGKVLINLLIIKKIIKNYKNYCLCKIGLSSWSHY